MNIKAILTTLGKVLAHGAAFAFSGYLAALAWAQLFIWYHGAEAWLALIGTLAAFAVVWGFLNLLLMYAFWFPVEHGWKSFLPQGFILFAVFFTIEVLPLHLLLGPLRSLGYVAFLAGFAIFNVFYAFADGWVAWRLGVRWKVRGIPTVAEDHVAFTPEPEIVAANPGQLHCPRCGGTSLVVAPDHSAYCITCGRGIRKERLGGSTG